MQDPEQEGSRLFNEVMGKCVRGRLLQVVAEEEVDVLYGPKQHPALQADYWRPRNEQGQASIKGQLSKRPFGPWTREKNALEIKPCGPPG